MANDDPRTSSEPSAPPGGGAGPDATGSPGLLRALRIPIALAWLVAAGGFLMPEDTGLAAALRLAFVGLLAVHAVECVIFLPALRASGRPLAGQLLQVLVFGVVHYGILQQEMAREG